MNQSYRWLETVGKALLRCIRCCNHLSALTAFPSTATVALVDSPRCANVEFEKSMV